MLSIPFILSLGRFDVGSANETKPSRERLDGIEVTPRQYEGNPITSPVEL
jgi:hypothetical protein